MMKKLLIAMLVFSAISTFGCGNIEAQKSFSESAKDFEIVDINGKNIRLSDYRGKVILLNFFTTWCPPCRMEMPDFNNILRKYRGKMQVIAINVGNESPGKVKEFVNQNNLEFPVAIDNGNVSMMYGPIRAIPVTVLINKDFNIAKRYIGMRSGEIFRRDIEELL